MDQPDQVLLDKMSNTLIMEEMSTANLLSEGEVQQAMKKLTDEQQIVFKQIMDSVINKKGKTFFVEGHGGTGKTFLWNIIISKLRMNGKIVLAVASSGIAALLMPNGRTAHSRFHIPLNASSSSTCDIKQKSHLAQLIKSTSLIIWDEAPMMHKYSFEALDRSLKDILKHENTDGANRLFGGMTVVLGGDFKQTLPIIPNSSREEVVNACIKHSYIWNDIHILKLTKNMRLKYLNDSLEEKTKITYFSNWILEVGQGSGHINESETWVDIPPDMLITTSENPLEDITRIVYPDLENNFNDDQYLQERAILAIRNDTVNSINDFIASKIEGEEIVYKSSDSVQQTEKSSSEEDLLYSTEFLNSMSFTGVPNHELKLKIGMPVMLLRNLDQASGLCNGTRLILTRLGQWSIEAKIMTDTNKGEKAIIPRIVFLATDTSCPITLRRKQFPISICFAMTVNKSQGQTLKHVGLYLTKPPFSRGQLYVAISRVTSPDGLKILVPKDKENPHAKAKNVVYVEVL